MMQNTTHSLYNNSIKIVFDPFEHTYRLDGRKVINVSSVLEMIDKPELIPWAVKMGVEFLKENIKADEKHTQEYLDDVLKKSKTAYALERNNSARFGTWAHQWVNVFVTTGDSQGLDIDDEQKAIVTRAFKKWHQDNNVTFLASEQMVYSQKHGYCGTFDGIIMLNGKRYLFDFKTNNRIYKLSMGGQMASYLEARTEEYPEEKYDGCYLLRIDKKTGKTEPWIINDWEPYYQTFLCMLKTYKCIKYLKEKKMA